MSLVDSIVEEVLEALEKGAVRRNEWGDVIWVISSPVYRRLAKAVREGRVGDVAVSASSSAPIAIREAEVTILVYPLYRD